MIEKIKRLMDKYALDGILIPREDSFLNAYFPPEMERLQKLTGFRGTAGLAFVTREEKVLFVDFRYTEQARREAEGWHVFEIPKQTTPAQWLSIYMRNKRLGIPDMHFSVAAYKVLYDKISPFGVDPVSLPEEELTVLFEETQERPAEVWNYDLFYTGESMENKLVRVAQKMKQEKVDMLLVCNPESVSWLTNRRSFENGEYPVVFERALVYDDATIQTFRYFPSNLERMVAEKRVGIYPHETPQKIYARLKAKCRQLKNVSPFLQEMRAIKNPNEVNAMREACISDSIVFCRFWSWLEFYRDRVTERDCVVCLNALRTEFRSFRNDSFPTISAAGEHAALPHYHVSDETNVPVAAHPMLMIDTGGHYKPGTTDMTRTICTGTPTPLMKRRYTQVLKGHIALAQARVKKSMPIFKLDQRAHAFLRADHVDYYHATGHGVGQLLGVHEQPPVIHEYAKGTLSPGMIFSNEPAYYDLKEGFGIRLENLFLVEECPVDRIKLHAITYVPFDPRLIDESLMENQDWHWLKYYHKTIVKLVFPFLSAQDVKMLTPFVDYFILRRTKGNVTKRELEHERMLAEAAARKAAEKTDPPTAETAGEVTHD